MSLNIGNNQISPILINNTINNLNNKTVIPNENVQTISIPQAESMEAIIEPATSLSGNVLVTNINASFLEYGKSYQVNSYCSHPSHNNINYSANGRLSTSDAFMINTVWTATEDGEINFTMINTASTAAERITLSKTQIKIYLPSNINAYRGSIANSYVYKLIFTPIDSFDGMNQVTIEAIPSDYIIPEGTLSILNSGIYDITSYANIDVLGRSGNNTFSIFFDAVIGKVNRTVTVPIGFKSVSEILSTSQQLPIINGTTIVPSEISQTYTCNSKWGVGSIIVDAIPETVGVYKKIIEKTVTVPELNNFLSRQTSLPSYTFMMTSTLNGSTGGVLNFYSLSSIPLQAFQSCSYLTHVSGINVTTISSQAFYACYRITSVYFPNLVTIGNQAFYNCSSLTEINFSKLSQINGSPFSGLSRLITASLPLMSILSGYDFYGCYSLTQVNLSGVEKMQGYSQFGYCSSLPYLYLSKLSLISGGYGTFYNCRALSWVSFPLLEKISGTTSIFSNCSKLTSVYFMNSSVITLTNTNQSNIFVGTPIVNSALTGTFGSIYVPSSLVNDYKTHSIWSWWADRFVGV